MTARNSFSLIVLFGLVSCGHIHTKSVTYSNQSPAQVNQAIVSTELQPQGGKPGLSVSAMVYMAGSAQLEGPFKWRIMATGKDGLHESMTLHRVSIRTTKSQRKDVYPSSQLPDDIPFVTYEKTPGVSYAVCQFPGLLEINPAEDGTSHMSVDLTIRSKAKAIRKTVHFTLVRSDEKETKFLFLPSEIAQSFGPKDPRQWKWTTSPL
ncbi:hypothetical protein SAMN02745181_3717 [Rubritalea squalenifaciens DSM 18772]|uniref:Lipoprotein n=1 Tax=Rubritalea squalenifaciens DSM 18772 TaxID=1123071 RepID=A0A1M6RYE1_9BACT|nr:hypothetical protein [Rubritalea squalenifaciens]SHK37486.1 hypothetical protein SAMN02745181_3717 [Rubritalea squalenifaciens DSM 18772]